MPETKSGSIELSTEESIEKEILRDTRDTSKDSKDVDILDPNFPLLKEFRHRAPGSFKHTQTLVSMVENVCSVIDMDMRALKIAAMYHDIGKMWFPELFTENQPEDENVHDELDPWISYQLLTRHVSDTVTILINHNFSTEVIQIASQHHGDTILKAIFEKAAKRDPSAKATEHLYRYRTNKPDRIESMILMLCDQVEATSRSIYKNQDIDVDPKVLVVNIYNKLLSDGQFDNVSVVLGKLKLIQQALVEDVASSFQKRVRYDEDDELSAMQDSN